MEWAINPDKMKKRGYFYSIDALIALMIILAVLIFFKPIPEQNIELKKVQEDVLKVLSNVKVGEVDNAYVKDLISKGEIDDKNKTILEQIGEFRVLGKEENAFNLTREMFNELKITENIGIWMDKEIVYTQNTTSIETADFVWTAQELVSGVKENIGNATTGFSARPLILRNFLTEYFYFGGYVGDVGDVGDGGRIIANLTYDGKIVGARLEAQISALGNPPYNFFLIYINGHYVNLFYAGITSLNVIDLSPYLNYFKSGDNIIEFVPVQNKIFISGGFIAVDYETSNLYKPKKEYRFPGIINGTINLYDSFYIPGDLNNMNIFLHYKTDYNTTLTIGNVSFKIPKDKTTYTLDNSQLSSQFNYTSLSKENIPLRLRLDELDFITSSALSNADIVLVLDTSASMLSGLNDTFNFGNGQSTGKDRTCDDPKIFDGDTSRLSAMKCVTKLFVDKILDTPGNRISVINFHDRSTDLMRFNLTSNKTAVLNRIDSLSIGGGTCVCCGLNNAYEEFTNNSDFNRRKITIIFTDGSTSSTCQPAAANPSEWPSCGIGKNTFCGNRPICPEGTFNGNSTRLPQYCGFSCEVNIPNEPDKNKENWAAIKNSIWSAEERLNRTQNATVYSIGLNPSGCAAIDYLMSELAEKTGGKNFTVTTGFKLLEAFNKIAEEITKLGYADQISVSTGVNNSILYPDSYIKFDYPDPSIPNGTALSYRLNFTNPGETTFKLSHGFNIFDAAVLSYSGAKWTKYMYINNSALNKIFFNLSNFGLTYLKLGDPFATHIHSDLIVEGDNNVKSFVGSYDNETLMGSINNKLALTISKPLSSYKSVNVKINGCNWTVKTVEGIISFNVPQNYSGSKKCIYDPTISYFGDYDINDAYDNVVLSLLQELDINGDRILDIPIQADSIDVETVAKAGIPFTWSSIVEIRVWR